MRVVFLGSPAFAVPSLRALAAHPEIDVPLVVTQPDRPAGRGRSLTPPAVKSAAEELGIPVYQPESLRDPAAADPLAAARPDVLVVVAYGELLRRHVLELAPAGCLNVHPSLLPRWRGASPIPAAILAGDATTGVSIMKLVRRLDAGPVVARQAVAVEPSDTTGTLGARLASLAATMLPEVALAWVRGDLQAREQDESRVTMTREWTTDDARIDWTRPAVEIERLVRAANPWPVAWTTLDGNRLRVVESRLAGGAASVAGQVELEGTSVVVGTGAGRLELVTVQPAGKRRLAAGDWWRGLRVDRTDLV